MKSTLRFTGCQALYASVLAALAMGLWALPPGARAAEPATKPTAPAAAYSGYSAAPPGPPTLADGVDAQRTLPSEPTVQRTLIEDKGSRIEEVRVRGQLQRVTVTPKVGVKASYEILPGDGSGSELSRSTAGKRVWNVLQF